MAVFLSPVGGAGAQFFDNNGNPLVGGKLYTYAAGTTTPQATYTSVLGNTAHANPIVLDAAGRVSSGGEIWLTDELAYKFVLASAANVTIATWDNVSGINNVTAGIMADFAAPNGSSLVGFVQDAPGAAVMTVQDKLRQTVSVTDFYANGVSGAKVDPSGVVDSTLGIQEAIDYVISIRGNLVFPPGLYKITGSGLTIDANLTAGAKTIMISGENAIIQNSNGPCISIGGVHVVINDITIRSVAGGHTITQFKSLSRSKFENVKLENLSTNYSLWDNNGEEIVTCWFYECEFTLGTLANPSTVHGFNIVTAGGDCNENVWENIWVNGENGATHFFYIEATEGYQYNNFFRNVTFEICNGGGIHLISNWGFEIRECANWDAEYLGSGPVRNDFYLIEDHVYLGNSYPSKGSIRDCSRWAGVNASGIYDIKLAETSNVLIENCGNIPYAVAFQADVGLSRATIIAPNDLSFQLINDVNATVVNNNKLSKFKGLLINQTENMNYGASVLDAIQIRSIFTGVGDSSLPTSRGALTWYDVLGAPPITIGYIDLVTDDPAGSTRSAMIFGCRVNGTLSETARFVATSGSFIPGTDNTTQSLGSAAKRWTVVYAGTGTINTSDEREKQDIENLDDAEHRVAVALKGLIRKFKFRDAVERKGDEARIHFGVIAQDVMAAFQAEGLDPMRYGIVCYDEWDDIYESVLATREGVNDKGELVQEEYHTGERKLAVKAGNRYGVRYEELLAFIIAAL